MGKLVRDPNSQNPDRVRDVNLIPNQPERKSQPQLERPRVTFKSQLSHFGLKKAILANDLNSGRQAHTDVDRRDSQF
jgi:hypothetical protein